MIIPNRLQLVLYISIFSTVNGRQSSVSKFITELEDDSNDDESYPGLLSFKIPLNSLNQYYQSASDDASVEARGVLHMKGLKQCGREYKCQITGATKPLSNKTYEKRINCYCDEECTRRGDCCKNSAYLDVSESFQNASDRKYWGCIPIDQFNGVSGITDCDGDLKELCSKAGDPDPVRDVPVYNPSSGITYANVYCALCHGLNTSDIVFPKTNKICHKTTDQRLTDEDVQNMEYKDLKWLPVNKSIGNTAVKHELGCYLDIQGIEPGRHCRPFLINTCPVENQSLIEYCSSYTMPVVNIYNKKIYKNQHCALCHNEKPEDVNCYHFHYGKVINVVPFTELISLDLQITVCRWPNTVWNPTVKSCVELQCDQTICSLRNSSFEGNNNDFERVLESYLTFIVLILSVILLLIHNFIYYIESKRQNIPSQILKSLSWSIIFAHLSFLSINSKELVGLAICKIIGYSTQYFYTATFFWMNVMSYDVWRTFSKVKLRSCSSSIMTKYNLHSWGFSTVLILITLIADFVNILPENIKPYMGEGKFCYFGSKLSMAIYFLTPVFIILLLNLYLFGKTVYWFQKQTSKELERYNCEATNRKEYRKIWLYIKLLIIMGLTWLFCIVAALTHIYAFRIVFIICNGLQGAMIFFMFDVKKRVLLQFTDNVKNRINLSNVSSESKNKETVETNSSRNVSLNNINKLNFN